MGKEAYLSILKQYIPFAAAEILSEWIIKYNFDLKITKGRLTKLGDYRSGTRTQRHLITINHDLNQYSFLVTFVHEIAHLTCWEKYGNRAKPHGQEWKQEFRELMNTFTPLNIFPEDVLVALEAYLCNPAASSCSDNNLIKALKKYDAPNKLLFVEDLPFNAIFKTINGRYFQKGEKIRTRYQCVEIKTRRLYLFASTAQVLEISRDLFSKPVES
jgi:hypothetical protein